MKTFGLKMVVLIVGVVLGLMLRDVPRFEEIPFINNTLMPFLRANFQWTMVITVALLGLVLAMSKD